MILTKLTIFAILTVLHGVVYGGRKVRSSELPPCIVPLRIEGIDNTVCTAVLLQDDVVLFAKCSNWLTSGDYEVFVNIGDANFKIIHTLPLDEEENLYLGRIEPGPETANVAVILERHEAVPTQGLVGGYRPNGHIEMREGKVPKPIPKKWTNVEVFFLGSAPEAPRGEVYYDQDKRTGIFNVHAVRIDGSYTNLHFYKEKIGEKIYLLLNGNA